MPSDKPLWGDGTLEFGRWETPFENALPQCVSLLEMVWGAGQFGPEELRAAWMARSLIKSPSGAQLSVLVSVHTPVDPTARYGNPDYLEDPLYRVSFRGGISAFRVLDEGGLIELWGAEWPGSATFRVRNHGWSRESILSFTAVEHGWSYVIATDEACLEVVGYKPPEITLENP